MTGSIPLSPSRPRAASRNVRWVLVGCRQCRRCCHTHSTLPSSSSHAGTAGAFSLLPPLPPPPSKHLQQHVGRLRGVVLPEGFRRVGVPVPADPAVKQAGHQYVAHGGLHPDGVGGVVPAPALLSSLLLILPPLHYPVLPPLYPPSPVIFLSLPLLPPVLFPFPRLPLTPL